MVKLKPTCFFPLFLLPLVCLSLFTNGRSMTNIYDKISTLSNQEQFTDLLRKKNVLVERIVSSGQITPEDKPYYQEQDEWVIILQGEARLKVNNKEVSLKKNDYILIPHHTKHWVTYTSKIPKTIWLTVHVFDHAVEK